jgi:hypothetical protein
VVSWRGLDNCRCGCCLAASKLPLNLLGERRPFFSSSSPDLGTKLRRSLGDLRNDGWAIFAAPVTPLAEGRPRAATVSSDRS